MLFLGKMVASETEKIRSKPGVKNDSLDSSQSGFIETLYLCEWILKGSIGWNLCFRLLSCDLCCLEKLK